MALRTAELTRARQRPQARIARKSDLDHSSRMHIAKFAAPLALLAAAVQAKDVPQSLPPVDLNAPTAPLPQSRDIAYPGVMTLRVDATDTATRAFRAVQTIPVAPGAREIILVYPKWLPGNHGPTGQIHRLGDLTFTAAGAPLQWRRDPGEPYAFRVALSEGTSEVTATLTYTSPFAEADWRPLMTPALANVQWEKMSLYPAGYAVRRVRVKPSLVLPAGWTAASALDGKSASGTTVEWAETDYETLVDSPVFAGAYGKSFDLGHDVRLNVFADRPEQLAEPKDMLAAHSRMVREMIALYGSRQFDHYDFLVALTDELGDIGLEHHRSTEITQKGDAWTAWDKHAWDRRVLPHEFNHSWNGKYRRPAGLWAPDYHAPVSGALLWLYEGQTNFWDTVIAARSGMIPKDVALGRIASDAAFLAEEPGRAWRSVEDTTINNVYSYRKTQPFSTLSRSLDYYTEGSLVWLEADQIIRRGTKEKRGLDDFARSFFGGQEGDWGVRTYTFGDIVAGLNEIYSYDWATFLDTRLRQPGQPAPIKGIEMAGYRLTWKDEPNPYTKQATPAGNFAYSLGFSISAEGEVSGAVWDSPGAKAGIVPGNKIVAVDGFAFSRDRLTDAIRQAKHRAEPIRLIVRRGDRLDSVELAYHDGLRFPWIEPVNGGPQPLDRLLVSRAAR